MTMKKILKWIIANSCLFQLSLVYAAQSVTASGGLSNTASDPLYRDFKFDSARLLQMNSTPSLSPHLVFNGLGYGASSKEGTESNQSPANGFFLYKLQQTDSRLPLPSNPFANNENQPTNSSLYGHLFQRLVQHLFVDLAGGYESYDNSAARFSPDSELYKYSSNANSYNKNWFASASALFTHTWKEFAFNANLGLTHAEANQDPSNFYFSQTMSPELGSSLQNKVSFLHENAELSYRASSLVQPFVGGGLLQVMTPNNGSQSIVDLALPGSLDPSLDSNGYKIGGGLSLNYKQYALRLEQQYFQRGELYRNNQSTLSFKVNLG